MRNFEGAAKEIERVYQVCQSKEVSDDLTIEGITWHFNSPLAPHQRGFWEAVIKSFKRHLKIVAGEVLLISRNYKYTPSAHRSMLEL